jgi:hypothetical protein
VYLRELNTKKWKIGVISSIKYDACLPPSMKVVEGIMQLWE